MGHQPGFSLDVADDGPVRWLVLSNPRRRNAITLEGFDRLTTAFESFDGSDRRVLVITGEDGHFSSGVDLTTEMVRHSAADNAKVLRRIAAAAATLHRLTKPTVAAVDGAAVGAAMNLALGCDIVLATERAEFAMAFVRRGLGLDFGGTWLLPRLVGLSRARELALTGRRVNGTEALAIGLVSRLVTVEELHAEAARTAAELAAGAPLAQHLIKSGLSRSSTLTFEQALRFENQAQAVLLATDDFAEGVEAFVARRPPRFRGR